MKEIDKARERRIRILNARMVAQYNWGQKAKARQTMAVMYGVMAGRSADQVSRMESATGLHK